MPLRYGKISNYRIDSGRLYLNVKLGEFIHPKDNQDFQLWIKENLPQLPVLTSNNQTNNADGKYAIESKKTYDKQKFLYGSNAWNQATDELKSCKSFDSANRLTIFSRPEFKNANNDEAKFKPKLILKGSNEHKLILNYKFFNLSEHGEIKYEIKGDENIQITSISSDKINNYKSRNIIGLKPVQYPNSNEANIKLNFITPNGETRELSSPSVVIPIKLKQPFKFYVWVLFLLFLFVAGDVFISLDSEKNLYDLSNLFKIFGALLKIFALFFLFRIFGKEASVMKAYQRIIREKKIKEKPIDFKIDLHDTQIKEISYSQAKKIILEYEWLETMGFTTKSIGHFYGDKLISVLNLGFPGGTQSRNVCGEENADKAICLVRGACTHFTPKFTPSYFISRALKYAAKEYGYKIFYAYADESAGEIGTIYQALNWYYLGRGVGRTKGRKRESYISPDGIKLSARSIRNRG